MHGHSANGGTYLAETSRFSKAKRRRRGVKEIRELNLPDDLRYTDSHEWAKKEGDLVRVGISDYAQDQLGDIVFVELPGVGDTYEKGEEFGTVESVKAVAELYMPVGGEIVGTNQALESAPELLNTDPYSAGWIVEIRPSSDGEIEALKNKAGYLEMLDG
jgi:glycine cleavage system H protein